MGALQCCCKYYGRDQSKCDNKAYGNGQRTIKFINDEAASVHGSLRASSIFTGESGEWKVGSFDILSSMKDEEAVIYVGGHVLETEHGADTGSRHTAAWYLTWAVFSRQRYRAVAGMLSNAIRCRLWTPLTTHYSSTNASTEHWRRQNKRPRPAVCLPICTRHSGDYSTRIPKQG